MEVDDTSLCSNFSTAFSTIRDVTTIETGVESMTLDGDGDDGVVEFPDINEKPGEICSSVTSEDRVFHSSAEAFLQLQREREDTTFSRTCLFCKKHFTGNRSLLLEHFTEQHNFFIGQPDNLVFINEFLDVLEKMLNKLQCLYCRKIFKDWTTLKEHMRKKMHKRINAADSSFDRFYMTNYLDVYDNMGPAISNYPQEIIYVNQDDDHLAQDDEREIDVEPKGSSIKCLYCSSRYFGYEEVINHLKVVHNFDFRYLKKEYKLCFYSQVKLINYIRKKVFDYECTICDIQCSSNATLIKHMTDSGHITLLPDQAKWDQSEFYFSTLHPDYFLCGLEGDDDDEEDCNSAIEIISEDIVLPKSSILVDENLRRTLL